MSSAISRFTTALLAGSQENTLALAALNFDFSLYKVEAPTEYKALGTCLSEERRRLAESGSHHITARKLGAIFRSKIPSVPNLIRAYGERVSEIAKSATNAEAVKNHTLFAEKIGIDGTAIWAAATSGNEALYVQLLACILARFWSSQEAVSIWAEIIDSRRQELSNRTGDYDFPEVAAMQANVTREQLAEWDASARAWLRAADVVKNKQQTQLRLIINNVNVAVNNTRSTYDSVMEAWVSSLKVVDNLVCGIPQSIYDGAALVGLSAWHLYPDMSVYEKTPKEIKQEDPLIYIGGILTIGLESSPESDRGVCWSLPLAKFRYYGDPVVATKTLGSRNSRVSFEQLNFVAIGCLSKTWPEPHVNYMNICSYYSLLWKYAEAHAIKLDKVNHGKSWLNYLGTASQVFLDSYVHGEDMQSLNRLMNFGRRRCESFFNSQGVPISFETQMLNMTKPKVFIRALKLNRRLEYLRRIAGNLSGRNTDWIIVYRDDENKLAFATALPCRGVKRLKPYRPSHCYWQNPSHVRSEMEGYHTPIHPWTVSYNDLDALLTISCVGLEWPDEDEFVFRYRPYMQAEGKTRHFRLNFKPVIGDQQAAMLCWKLSKQRGSPPKIEVPESVSYEEILSVMRRDGLSNLPDFPRVHGWEALQALGAVGGLYNTLRTANISMDITSSALESAEWVKYSGDGSVPWYCPLPITREAAFSCIILLETGDQDLDPKQLTSVMAISVSDSIYAASPLTCDPYKSPEGFEICRALGNVGKAGVSLLIPPPRPRIRQHKNDEWNVINHDTWNGKSQNSFDNTSLHLSLTEYRVPYTTEHEGARDIQAFFQEAVISVYDGGVWIGDIDILKSLSKSQPDLLRVSQQCPHGAHEISLIVNRDGAVTQAPRKASTELITITSIDNWSELLDTPKNPVVVRSHENWLGRLAAASLSSQLGHRTIILPHVNCKKGCFSNINFMRKWILENGDVVIF